MRNLLGFSNYRSQLIDILRGSANHRAASIEKGPSAGTASLAWMVSPQSATHIFHDQWAFAVSALQAACESM